MIERNGTIHSAQNRKLCLDLPDSGRAPRNHDPVQLHACHGGPNQRFVVER